MTGLEGSIWPYLDNQAIQDVRDYYQTERYEGRYFNSLRGGGDRSETRDYFEGDDIVAVAMLSVAIPRGACAELLEGRRDVLHDLLEQIPHDAMLWDDRAVDEWVGKDRPGWRLWYELVHRGTKGIPNIGWVTANKLLARKRPELFPVYDQVVKAALDPFGRNFWEPLRIELRADGRKALKRLEEIQAAADVPQVPLLRVLDVAVWMRDWGRAKLGQDRP